MPVSWADRLAAGGATAETLEQELLGRLDDGWYETSY